MKAACSAVRLFGSAEAFERRDRLAGGFTDGGHAGPHRLAVHHDRAGAALAEAAAEFRGVEPKTVPQDVEEWLIRIPGVDRLLAAVDPQLIRWHR